MNNQDKWSVAISVLAILISATAIYTTHKNIEMNREYVEMMRVKP